MTDTTIPEFEAELQEIEAEEAAMLRRSPAVKAADISNKFRLASAIDATRGWRVPATAPLGRVKRR
jgi:hypothetical protein